MNGDNLPYQDLDVVPFTPITSEWGDGIGEDLLALAGGTGFDPGAITTDTLAQSAVTPNKLALGQQFARVDTAQSTSSTSYTNLTTTGPVVTCTVGQSGAVLISFSCNTNIATSSGVAYLSFAVSGSTTIVASEANGVLAQASQATHNLSLSKTLILTGLTPGSNTFTLQYKTLSSSVNFSVRCISVVPL